MSINSTFGPDKLRQQFYKIKFLNYMSFDIAAFGENQGIEKLVEKVDLKCGAIPDGEYEQVIDQTAPNPFLELYMRIAEFRFAFSVTALLKANEGYITPLINYCYEQGKANKPEKIKTVNTAYEYINSFILDGMPDEEVKEITTVEPGRLVWHVVKETHESFWNKAEGSVEVYYKLQNALIEGLLEGSDITFINEGNTTFTLQA